MITPIWTNQYSDSEAFALLQTGKQSLSLFMHAQCSAEGVSSELRVYKKLKKCAHQNQHYSITSCRWLSYMFHAMPKTWITKSDCVDSNLDWLRPNISLHHEHTIWTMNFSLIFIFPLGVYYFPIWFPFVFIYSHLIWIVVYYYYISLNCGNTALPYIAYCIPNARCWISCEYAKRNWIFMHIIMIAYIYIYIWNRNKCSSSKDGCICNWIDYRMNIINIFCWLVGHRSIHQTPYD